MLTHRIRVPTPFAVGDVNAYLLGPEPLTLVDCGPRTEAAWAALLSGIEAAGRRVADVRRLVLTHAHPDHVGLARRVRAESGCTVLAHPADHARLTGAPGEWEAIVGFLGEVCRRAGAPAPAVRLLEATIGPLALYAEPVEEVSPLAEGDRLALGEGTLRVLGTPGHARGALCLWDPGAGVLLTGDTLLPHISSNAILEPGEGAFRERSLRVYLDTLTRVEGLAPGTALPGHGEPFAGAADLIGRRRAFHEERAGEVLALVEGGAERPWEIARALFPEADPGYAHLAVSEVVGHLDLLADRGRIRFAGQEGPWVARPARPAPGVGGQLSHARARSTARRQPA